MPRQTGSVTVKAAYIMAAGAVIAAIITAIVLFIASQPATISGQKNITVTQTGAGSVHITNTQGISADQFQKLTEELGVTKAALKNFFKILEQRAVSPEDLDSTLRTIAERYKTLDEKLKTLASDDPIVQVLKEQARQALEAGKFDRAEQLLNEASEKDLQVIQRIEQSTEELEAINQEENKAIIRKHRRLAPERETVSTSSMSSGEVFQDRLKDGSLGPEMVHIAEGCFQMGSPESEQGGDNDERHHRVCVQGFVIGKYEVTFEEYDRFAAATGRESPDDEGWGRGRQPVINLSWHDAVAYAQWLSEQMGKDYRLPTEAEWEYAARAGSDTPYPWGDDVGYNRANCMGFGSRWDQRTAPVGSFAANAWGLHDTVGNVWEWTCSKYSKDYDGLEQRCAGSGDTSSFRVTRGGGWGRDADGCRSAYRVWNNPGDRFHSLGFRLASQ